MALSFTARLFMNSKILRTERILQSLPKCGVYESSKKYLNAVKQINLENTINGTSELMQFPSKSFHTFPTDCLKTMIEESLNILKLKGKARSINVYNKMMYSMWNNKIDFDVDLYLHDIVDNKLRINSDTFDIIIKCYSREKRISDIENVLEKMEKEGINLQRRSMIDVIYAYIVTGNDAKAEEFIKAKEIDANSPPVFESRMRAYAALGDTERLFPLLTSFSDYNKAFFLSDLYRIMTKANVPESKLETLIGMMDSFAIVETIKVLNQDQFYTNGLHLLEQHIDNIERKLVYRGLMTFMTPTCPSHVYKRVLDLTLSNIFRVRLNCNVFSYMSFDDALSYSLKSSTAANGRVIGFSILNRAIETKSNDNIHEALKFCQTALKPRVWHFLIHSVLIESLINQKLVKDTRELLSIFTHSQYGLLPDVFLYHICRGEFSEVDRLHADYPDQFFRRHTAEMTSMVYTMVGAMGIRNFPKVHQELCRLFSFSFCNKLLSLAFAKKLLLSCALSGGDDNSNSGAGDNMGAAVVDADIRLIQEMGIKFLESDIKYLSKKLPSYVQMFKALPLYEHRLKSEEMPPVDADEIKPAEQDQEQPDQELSDKLH